MSSAKRLANSPAEKAPENKKIGSVSTPFVMTAKPSKQAPPVEDPSNGSLIKFEILALNNSPFYGTISEVEILHIWEKVLGQSRTDIYAMTYSRSLKRNFKVTIKHVLKITPSELYPEPEFEYRRGKPDSDEVDVFSCKLIGFSELKPAEIGQLTRITVKTNEFSVTASQIIPWLVKFGTLSSNHDLERNSLGLRTDVFQTEIVLRKHIPEFLPIAGRKVLVNYPGIPKSCNNCYQVGHLKRNCRLKKREWIDRVHELRSSGEFEDELFGGWIPILDQRPNNPSQ
jgi:hypothetical protein